MPTETRHWRTYGPGGALISDVPFQYDPGVDNTTADLLAKARAALTTNATFLAGVAARRTSIAADKATATTGQTATVTTVAQAQTQIRSQWTVLTHAATALDDLNNEVEAIGKQNDAIIKLLAGMVLGASDLLADSTGT